MWPVYIIVGLSFVCGLAAIIDSYRNGGWFEDREEKRRLP